MTSSYEPLRAAAGRGRREGEGGEGRSCTTSGVNRDSVHWFVNQIERGKVLK